MITVKRTLPVIGNDRILIIISLFRIKQFCITMRNLLYYCTSFVSNEILYFWNYQRSFLFSLVKD